MAGGNQVLKLGDFPPLPSLQPYTKPFEPFLSKKPKIVDRNLSSEDIKPHSSNAMDDFKHKIPYVDLTGSKIVDRNLTAPPPIDTTVKTEHQAYHSASLAKQESKMAQTYLGSYPLKPRYIMDGLPCVSFNIEDKDKLVSKIKFVVIAKFSHGRPTFNLKSLNFRDEFNVSAFDFKHTFIEFRAFEDFAKLWMIRAFSIKGFGVRLFRWVDTFNPSMESSFAPIWIHFPGLPLYLIEEDAILSLAAAIGNPLSLDQRNLSHNKTAYVSVCVALDVSIKHPEAIFVEFKGKGETKEYFVQKVIYGDLPTFCVGCLHQGHKVEDCKRSIKRAGVFSIKDSAGDLVVLEQKQKTVEAHTATERLEVSLSNREEHIGSDSSAKGEKELLEGVLVEEDSSEEEGEFIPYPKDRENSTSVKTTGGEVKDVSANQAISVVAVTLETISDATETCLPASAGKNNTAASCFPVSDVVLYNSFGEDTAGHKPLSEPEGDNCAHNISKTEAVKEIDENEDDSTRLTSGDAAKTTTLQAINQATIEEKGQTPDTNKAKAFAVLQEFLVGCISTTQSPQDKNTATNEKTCSEATKVSVRAVDDGLKSASSFEKPVEREMDKAQTDTGTEIEEGECNSEIQPHASTAASTQAEASKTAAESHDLQAIIQYMAKIRSMYDRNNGTQGLISQRLDIEPWIQKIIPKLNLPHQLAKEKNFRFIIDKHTESLTPEQINDDLVDHLADLISPLIFPSQEEEFLKSTTDSRTDLEEKEVEMDFSDSVEDIVAPKRRGRPPKQKEQLPTTNPPQVPRRKGRPRKFA